MSPGPLSGRDHSQHATPAAFPDAQAEVSTLFSAVHCPGLLAQEEPLWDAYALFYSLSAGRGWLTPGVPGSRAGLWGMNDAGQTGDGKGGTWIWFQTVVALPLPSEQPVPVQAFLGCVNQVLERLGATGFDATIIVLPHPPRAPASPNLDPIETLVSAASWFAGIDRSLACRVEITLEGIESAGLGEAGTGVRDSLDSLSEQVFRPQPREEMLSADPPPVMPPHEWPGTAERLTIDGILAEWSLEAIGWTAALVSEACRAQQVRAPLRLSFRRTR